MSLEQVADWAPGLLRGSHEQLVRNGTQHGSLDDGPQVERVESLAFWIDHGIDEGQAVAGKQPWRGRTGICVFGVNKRLFQQFAFFLLFKEHVEKWFLKKF